MNKLPNKVNSLKNSFAFSQKWAQQNKTAKTWSNPTFFRHRIDSLIIEPALGAQSQVATVALRLIVLIVIVSHWLNSAYSSLIVVISTAKVTHSKHPKLTPILNGIVVLLSKPLSPIQALFLVLPSANLSLFIPFNWKRNRSKKCARGSSTPNVPGNKWITKQKRPNSIRRSQSVRI